MAQLTTDEPPRTLELRFKRWTAVGVVCMLGLLAALPFRSHPDAFAPTVAPSHRERSLRFRAESEATETMPLIGGRRPASDVATEFGTDAAPRTFETPEQVSAVLAADLRGSAAEGRDQAVRDWAGKKPPGKESSGKPIAGKERDDPPESRAGYCQVQPGENLMDVAERVLNDRRRWRELMEANPSLRSPFDELDDVVEIAIPKSR